ncbi:MAG: gamma-butyrobetaine hydroxylase-like domain-containing protein, partial [Alphaproteobacteria bacterium]
MRAVVEKMGREIQKTTPGPRSVHVSFDDGHTGEFHYIWLRDNCHCRDCRHPQTLERTFDLLSVPEDIHARGVSLTEDGALEVVWSADSHRSVYDQDWLREHCYCAS